MSHLARASTSAEGISLEKVFEKVVKDPCSLATSWRMATHARPPPPPQTAMPYITLTLKYRFKRTCLSKNRHFLMRLNLFAKFFFSSLTCEVRQRPRVCYNGPNLGSTVRGKWERGDQ